MDTAGGGTTGAGVADDPSGAAEHWERSARSWMRAYPRRWREARGEELLGLLLDLAEPGSSRVDARLAFDLLKGGWATRLRELDIVVIDHDRLARAVVEPGSEGLAAVVAEFGPGVLTAAGDLDRSALGARVFADPVARTVLNGLIHPRVAVAAHLQEEAAVAAGATIVVHDIPLLVETGQAGSFDEVVVVDAPAGLRVDRLVEGRGLTAEQAWSRLLAQAGDGERRAVADRELDGSGTAAGLRAQVDSLAAAWRGSGEGEGS